MTLSLLLRTERDEVVDSLLISERLEEVQPVVGVGLDRLELLQGDHDGLVDRRRGKSRAMPLQLREKSVSAPLLWLEAQLALTMLTFKGGVSDILHGSTQDAHLCNFTPNWRAFVDVEWEVWG